MQEEEKPKTDYMSNDLMAKEGIEQSYPGAVVDHHLEDGIATVRCENAVALRLYFLTPKMLRFRFAHDGDFEDDFSYAIDPAFNPETPEVRVQEHENSLDFITSELTVSLSKDSLLITITDKHGTVISRDEKGFHWQGNSEFGGDIVMSSKELLGGEQFYGLGDKSCSLNLRKRRFQLWGADTYGYGRDSDPLYKNVPFYVGLHHKISYGIFFDNTFRSFFDFGKERSNVTSFFAQGGEMNYYFMLGPSQKEVAESYAMLTGRPELPPLWALGYHQCKWSYESEETVTTITNKFRELKIPCDAIYLDIDYMDGFRCFTWNHDRFKDPKAMVQRLESEGFKTVVIIDPGIKIDPNYWVYREGKEGEHFCKRMDGALMKGSVWPGLCCFPDFTKPEAREWWSGLFKGLIKDTGVRGVWNDMNEPAVFELGTFPRDVRHDYDGHPCSHRKAHNIYGMQMVRATQEGLKRYGDDRRPFAITRSAFAGTQRFALGWTGDNVASWEHLRIANVQCQRLSLSGMSFIGSDIGGFIESPDGELFVRWLQMAIFHPFCRTHSSGDHGEQEPWSFGEPFTGIARKFIELRYQLLPYIYTTFWQHVHRGTPMLRSLPYLAQDDAESHYREEEFALGDALLVCPVSEPQKDGRFLYLPDGQWFDFWDPQHSHEGNNELWAATPLDQIPVFVRAGSVLPIGPVQQYVGERTDERLTLHVYHAEGESISELYEDAGDGYGEQLRKQFRLSTAIGKRWSLEQQREGKFQEAYATYDLVIHGLPFNPTIVQIDDQPHKCSALGMALQINDIPNNFHTLQLT